MSRIEYRVAWVRGHDGKTTGPEIQHTLNDLTAQGWTLVQLVSDYASGLIYMVFVREI